ncbi:MAG: hypothetical protein QXV17_14105 [Candidatus Micrarchaeaceae archaeon]
MLAVNPNQSNKLYVNTVLIGTSTQQGWISNCNTQYVYINEIFVNAITTQYLIYNSSQDMEDII